MILNNATVKSKMIDGKVWVDLDSLCAAIYKAVEFSEIGIRTAVTSPEDNRYAAAILLGMMTLGEGLEGMHTALKKRHEQSA